MSQIDEPQAPLTHIKEPASSDIVCGRGARVLYHHGNQVFRHLVYLNRELYRKLCPKREKALISQSIVDAIRCHGRRFLEWDSRTGTWYDIGDEKAREKTSQALRGKTPKVRKRKTDYPDDFEADLSSVEGDEDIVVHPVNSSTAKQAAPDPKNRADSIASRSSGADSSEERARRAGQGLVSDRKTKVSQPVAFARKPQPHWEDYDTEGGGRMAPASDGHLPPHFPVHRRRTDTHRIPGYKIHGFRDPRYQEYYGLPHPHGSGPPRDVILYPVPVLGSTHDDDDSQTEDQPWPATSRKSPPPELPEALEPCGKKRRSSDMYAAYPPMPGRRGTKKVYISVVDHGPSVSSEWPEREKHPPDDESIESSERRKDGDENAERKLSVQEVKAVFALSTLQKA